MPPIVLALAVALRAAAAENPADLADRVATAGPAAREEAEGRLEEIGRPALPALRIALGKARDADSARRLADLIDLIERKRLLRATSAALDAKGATVAEAVADLGRRAGFRLVLDPPDDPAWSTARVTAVAPGPLPFWEAVDRLGAAGGFRVEAVSPWFSPAPAAPTVRLVRGDGPPTRTSYAGPFRVDLVSLNRHRQVAQPRPGSPPRPIDEFSVAVHLVPEPGLVVDRNGPPRLAEAVDDRGADLRAASTFDPATRNAPAPRQWRGGSPTALAYKIPLAIPAARGGTLVRLRGHLPVVVLARTGPLMTVSLSEAVGRPFAASGVTLTIHGMDRSRDRIEGLRVSVAGEGPRSAPPTAPGPRQLSLAPLRPAYQADDHIQVLDDQGRPFLISAYVPPSRGDGPIEFRVTLFPNPGLGPPSTLRYYGLVGEATEVPFLFEGVPLP